MYCNTWLRTLSLSFTCLTLSAACLWQAPATQAATVEKAEVASLGHFKADGSHNNNPNTLTGRIAGDLSNRSYFAFNLQDVIGTITAAEVSLTVATYEGAGTSKTMTIHDVSTPFVDLGIWYHSSQNNLTQGASIYDDLGGGTQYGTLTVPNNSLTVTASLNSALADLNSAAGNGHFIFGLDLLNPSVSSSDYVLFSETLEPGIHTLSLTVEPAATPEPQSIILMAIALAVVVFLARRRRAVTATVPAA